MTATIDSTNVEPRAMRPIGAPLPGVRFPKNRISTNDSAGIAGNSQAEFSTARSALHLVDFVEIRAVRVAVDQQHDRKADADLGGGDGDHEQGEHLAGDRGAEGGERDEVEVDRV